MNRSIGRRGRVSFVVAAGLVALWGTAGRAEAPKAPAAPAAARAAFDAKTQRALLDQYCVTCHNGRAKAGNLMLDSLDVAAVGSHPEIWEKVVRKMRAGLMPPAGRPRPEESTYDAFVVSLEGELD